MNASTVRLPSNAKSLLQYNSASDRMPLFYNYVALCGGPHSASFGLAASQTQRQNCQSRDSSSPPGLFWRSHSLRHSSSNCSRKPFQLLLSGHSSFTLTARARRSRSAKSCFGTLQRDTSSGKGKRRNCEFSRRSAARRRRYAPRGTRPRPRPVRRKARHPSQ